MTKNGVGNTVRTAVYYSKSENTIRRHETINPDSWARVQPRYQDSVTSPWVDPDWASGDGTLLDSSARFPCDEGSGWAEWYPVSGEHTSLVKGAKTEIRNSLTDGQAGCAAAARREATEAVAVTEAAELAIAV